jgi:actin-related protein
MLLDVFAALLHVRKEVRGFLPIDATMNVRKASDPVFDAWKGAAQWPFDSSAPSRYLRNSLFYPHHVALPRSCSLMYSLPLFLPIDATMNVRKASDPVFDAWKGAAQWASGGDLGPSREGTGLLGWYSVG